MDKPVLACTCVSMCIKWCISDLPGRRLTPLKREWGSLTVKYKVSNKASRTPLFTALINRQTWSQLDATSPVVSGLGELWWGVEDGGVGLSASHSFTLQIFKRAWHHLKISREQTNCRDCSYKEKNTGHVLIWLNLIRLWSSSCLTSCAGALGQRQTHLSQNQQRKLEGDITMKGPSFDSRGVYNLSPADEINIVRKTKSVTGETNKLWRWQGESFQAVRVNQICFGRFGHVTTAQCIILSEAAPKEEGTFITAEGKRPWL